MPFVCHKFGHFTLNMFEKCVSHIFDKRGKIGKGRCSGMDMDGGCLSGESVSKARAWSCVNCDFNLCQPCHNRYESNKDT